MPQRPFRVRRHGHRDGPTRDSDPGAVTPSEADSRRATRFPPAESAAPAGHGAQSRSLVITWLTSKLELSPQPEADAAG